jgi:hypothetical protein
MTTMTTMTTAATGTTEGITWRCPRAGLWIATGAEGGPTGIVSERWRRGFVVTAGTGRDLGAFATLDEARAALVLHDQSTKGR